MTDEQNKYRQFLLELRELTNKHGLAIGGCGCWGSPFFYEIIPDERGGYIGLGGDCIAWISPSQDEEYWEKQMNSNQIALPKND